LALRNGNGKALYVCTRFLRGKDLKSQERGCQMAYFQNKNPNLGKILSVLQWKMLVYFMAIWSSYGHLAYLWQFRVIWYIFHVLVCGTKKKSGNPGQENDWPAQIPLHRCLLMPECGYRNELGN
jgi:hypothetical protein